jgi:hypothetical protein
MWPRFVATTVVFASWAASAETSAPSAAIVEHVDLPPDLMDVRSALRTAAESVVREKGWSVSHVRSGESGQCESPGALDAVAREEASEYVLCVGGVYRSGHYDLDVRLWKAAVGWTNRQSEPAECPRCTVPQFVDHVGAWTRTLLSAEAQRIATERSNVPAAPPPPQRPIVEPSAEPRPGHGVSTALIAGGALGVAAGGVLWWAHGRDLDCENGPSGQRACPRRLNTRLAGISLLALGTVAVSWGILRSSFGDSTVAVGVGATNVSLAGRF